MRWFSRRTRVFLVAVLVFLATVVVALGVLQVVNPGFSLLEAVGYQDSDRLSAFRTKPYWSSLTPAQADALAPLEGVWSQITPARKKKWLEIASRMEKMSAEERERIRERIKDWVGLTPEERKKARQNYLSAKKAGVRDKSLQWLEYQALPDEEKQEYVRKARKKTRVANPEMREKKAPPPPAAAEEPVAPKAPETVKKEEEPEYWR